MINKTETETLLETLDMTMQDVYKIIGWGVTKSYEKASVLKNYTTIDDMTQDVLLYYLSTMKSTGEIRLNHYIKTLDKEHLIHMLQQSGRQIVQRVSNSRSFKERPYLVTSMYDSDDDYDNIADDKLFTNGIDTVEKENMSRELVDLIVDKLNTYNFRQLKLNYQDNMSFFIDTKNCLIAYKKTLKQLKFIIDRFNGVPKSEMQERYGSGMYRELKNIQRILGKDVEEYLRAM